MNTLKLSGKLYAEMLRIGAARLRDNIKIVNDLNVFPIPDGDTGDNMSMTIDSGFAAVSSVSDESSLDAISSSQHTILISLYL